MGNSTKIKSVSSSEDKAAQSTVLSGSFRVPLNHRWRKLYSIIVIAGILAITGYLVYNHFHAKEPIVQDAGYQQNIDQIKNTRPADSAPVTDRANYYSTLGAAYASAGKTDQTITALSQAEKLYTQPADKYGVWYDLAKAYETKGDKKKAVDYYKKVLNFAQNPPVDEPKDDTLIRQLQQKIKQLGG